MSFLDGFLIRDSNILKSYSVEDKIFDRLERNQSVIRPYTTAQVREFFNKAKSKVQGRVMLDLKEHTLDEDNTYGFEKETLISTGGKNKKGKASNSVIMSSLWQIKSNIPEDLFIKLQSLFDEGPVVQDERRRNPSPDETTLLTLIDRVEEGSKISVSLQNSLYDRKLLTTKQLLLLELMVTTGVRNMHPNIYDKLVERKEDGSFQGTELYEKVMKRIEILSGNQRPDRKALKREYKLISNGKKNSIHNLIRLINQDRYRFQGQKSSSDIRALSVDITDKIDDTWDELMSDFKEVFEEYDEAEDKTNRTIEWSNRGIESKIDVSWNAKSTFEREENSREQLAGEEYKSVVKKIEECYKKLRSMFLAYNKLAEMLSDKQLNVEVDTTREIRIKEDYEGVKEAIQHYNRYKGQITQDEREERSKLENLKNRERAAEERLEQERAQGNLPGEETTSETASIGKPDKEVPLSVNSDIESLRARVKALQEKRDKK